jgi:hypothetical protein
MSHSSPKQASPDEVRAYYDQFLKDRMVHYRIIGNERIEKAINLVSKYVSSNSNDYLSATLRLLDLAALPA